ncbi:hypothetical protein GGI43DRAFT_388685 [Trichoderma evansii]
MTLEKSEDEALPLPMGLGLSSRLATILKADFAENAFGDPEESEYCLDDDEMEESLGDGLEDLCEDEPDNLLGDDETGLSKSATLRSVKEDGAGSSIHRNNRKRNKVQQPSSNSGWVALPRELREEILEYLEVALQGEKASSYASVCREWHQFFKPYIFRRLKLSANRIQELDTFITAQCRPFVKSIWFRFERSANERRIDFSDEAYISFKDSVDINLFLDTKLQLFRSLSQWKQRDKGQSGIALELSAFSAIDPDYSMKDTIPEDLKDVDVTEDSDTLNAIYDKPFRRDMRILTEEEDLQKFKLRFGHYPPEADHRRSTLFPTVNSITNLTVRRQMHSSFFTKHIHVIVKAPPKLESLIYEPSTLSFISRHLWSSETSYIDNVENVTSLMPSSIRRLQIFLDDISLYYYLRREIEDDVRDLARRVFNRCRNKETPEIAQPSYKLEWAKFTSLVLTSSRITRRYTHKSLLLAAARAAQHMPKLEIMKLYNAETDYDRTFIYGGIFTYIHDKEGSHIYWKGTWEYEFPLEVIDEWRTAAATHGTDVFGYQSSMIEEDDLGWPGRIVSMLRTRQLFIPSRMAI